MSKPNLTRILAGVLIALALLLGFLAWSLSRRPPVRASATLVRASFPVVVAARTLAAGEPISPGALRVEALPIHPNGAFSDPAQLTGRVPTVAIGVETPVLASQLSSGLAEEIGPGERAVAVRVDEDNAVGSRLRPGNMVDVFFTLKRDNNGLGGTEIARSQARLLLSKVRVLAFGNATAGTDAQGGMNSIVRTAVLAVPVADVDELTLAQASGRLVFALRNPKDNEIIDAAAFAPPRGVLKLAANVPPGVAAQALTRAAQGLALDELSGAAGSATAHAAPGEPRPRPAERGEAGRAYGSIEVIRGGQAGMVAR